MAEPRFELRHTLNYHITLYGTQPVKSLSCLRDIKGVVFNSHLENRPRAHKKNKAMNFSVINIILFPEAMGKMRWPFRVKREPKCKVQQDRSEKDTRKEIFQAVIIHRLAQLPHHRGTHLKCSGPSPCENGKPIHYLLDE